MSSILPQGPSDCKTASKPSTSPRPETLARRHAARALLQEADNT